MLVVMVAAPAAWSLAAQPPAVGGPGVGGSEPGTVQAPSSGPEYPAAPQAGVFVSDRAAAISLAEVKLINQAAAEVFARTGVPVMVVTIRSVESMGGEAAAGVEGYARGLFNHWGIGRQDDNRGVLVLYSREDRKVRMQLGRAWPASQDAAAQGIVDGVITPPIQRRAPGEGLLAGVRAVGAMIEADNRAKGIPIRTDGLGTGSPADVPIPLDLTQQRQSVFSSLGGAWIWILGGVVVLVIVAVGIVAAARRSAGGGGGW
ncbi:MAG: TPM domain-containing protein [Chloroflexi bacterium]|nr:TPM domain-containing protein [Chloroflexota bacterium]